MDSKLDSPAVVVEDVKGGGGGGGRGRGGGGEEKEEEEQKEEEEEEEEEGINLSCLKTSFSEHLRRVECCLGIVAGEN